MLKSVGSNWLLAILKIASAFILMPIVVRALGTAEYGAWILVGSATGYLGLLILGAPMASVRFITKAIAAGDVEELNVLVSTFAGLYLLAGAACLVVGIGVFFVFDALYQLPAALAFEAHVCILIAVVSAAAGFVLQLPYAVLAANRQFVWSNLIVASTTILRFLLTILVLKFWPSIVAVAAIQLLLVIVEFIVAATLIRRRYPEIRIALRRFHPPLLREVLAFSVFVLILGLAGQLNNQTASLIIGKYLGLEQIAFFSIASSLTIYFIEFIIGIASVVMPTATSFESTGDADGLRRMFLMWSKIAGGLKCSAPLIGSICGAVSTLVP